MWSIGNSVNDWVENLSETKFAYLVLAPTLIIFGAIALWPIVFTFQTSMFADSFSQFRGGFVALENYVSILTGSRDPMLVRPFIDLSRPFQSVLPTTLIFTVVSVVFITALGFIQALVLNKTFRGRSVVRTAVLIPWAVPIVIQGMIFYLLFIPGGFGTQLLNDLGLVGPRPLSSSASTVGIVTLAAIWKRSAYVALIVLAGLQSIDEHLYDVARVAGASRWQQFRMITLPQAIPVLMIAMLLTSIGSMRIYGQIDAISNCSTMPSITCAVVGTFNGSLYGTASALAVLTAVLIGLVSLIYLGVLSRSRTGGF
ncbi:multiple sugar transport system permease protein [Halogranum amylolyticum]|uniref:Multiple sugar transport system permease protein n=2 Tax=Halogranum amylolyticum TaxID=660520 RepID=A0A1H8WCX0_9EURY|nr:sugar ABC transporter permease [Halogranum amylolyticum]SEP25504.1 multiple sugar transport system permease protein [Halogranum amylolyticum]